MASSLFPERPRESRASDAVQQARQMMTSNAPMVGWIKAMCGTRNPKEVFYETCRQQGINPEDILQMIR